MKSRRVVEYKISKQMRSRAGLVGGYFMCYSDALCRVVVSRRYPGGGFRGKEKKSTPADCVRD